MLTPVDLKNHTFKPSMGRYDKNEVDIFMDSVQADYENLYKKNSELNATIAQLTTEVNDYRKQQSTLANAMLLADETRTRIEKDATEAAEKLKSEAQAEADKVKADAQAEADKLVSDAKAEADERLTKATTEADEIQSKTDSVLDEARAKADSLTSEAQSKHDSLISDAKAEADKLVSDAKAQADKELAEAKTKTDNMLAEKNSELKEINDQIEDLKKCHDEYKTKFEEALQKQLDAVKSGNLDVVVPGLAEKTKAAKETYEANEALVSKAKAENSNLASAPSGNDRIKAFDASEEDLDENGLNASGLNFDIDKNSNGGIVIDDFESPAQDADTSAQVSDEPSAPTEASETASETQSSADNEAFASKSSDSDYADFQNVPSFNNMDEFVAHSPQHADAPQSVQSQPINDNAQSDLQPQEVDTGSYGYVKTANGYEMPADMGEDEFSDETDSVSEASADSSQIPSDGISGSQADSDNNGNDDGNNSNPFKFINA